MHTKSSAVAILGLACLAATALAPHIAEAAIIENIFEEGTPDLLGSISFPSISGDSSAGVILSYGSFTAADVTSVSWALDPSTDDVVAIDLSAVRGDADCNIGSNCSNSTLDLSLTTATTGSKSCSFGDGHGECSAFQIPTGIEYVPTVVPEPSTWAMTLLGFAGLGYAGYKRRGALVRA